MPDVPYVRRIRSIAEDTAVQELVRRKNAVSLSLTLITLLLYFSLIFLIAYNPASLAGRVAGNMRWGIPLGIGLIVVCWILTGIYVRWANDRYDSMVADIKSKLGE